MTRDEATQASLNLNKVFDSTVREFRMAAALREAMARLGHECDVVAFAVLFAGPQGTEPGSIQRTDRHTMVAQCPRCGQLRAAADSSRKPAPEAASVRPKEMAGGSPRGRSEPAVLRLRPAPDPRREHGARARSNDGVTQAAPSARS